MNKQAGFTLIELVAVMVILALLGAMAVPRFFDVSSEALVAAQNGSIAGVRSGHAMAIAALKRPPQVSELIDYVGGSGVSVAPGADGIQVLIDGNPHIVKTYSDTTCSTQTGDPTDDVLCVGQI